MQDNDQLFMTGILFDVLAASESIFEFDNVNCVFARSVQAGPAAAALEADAPALGALIEQDRDIAGKSGHAPLKIVSARRVGAEADKMMKVK